MKKVCLSLVMVLSMGVCDGLSGAGEVIAKLTDNLKKGGSAQHKDVSFAIHKETKSVIDRRLQEQLDKLKNNDEIKVQIYLDTVIEQDIISKMTVEAFLNSANEVSEKKVVTSDSILKSVIDRLSFEDKIAMIEEKRVEQVEKNRQKRVEKSNKMLDQLLKKLEKKSLDRLISFDEDAGILKVILRKNEILKFAKHSEYILAITPTETVNPNLDSAFDEIRLNTTWWPVRNFGGQGVGIYMNEWGNACFEQSNVTPIEDLIGLGGGAYTEDRERALHADQVAQSLRTASPQSHIYCSDERYSLPSNWKDDIHIVNYSWNSWTEGNENSTAWDHISASADNHSYNDNVQLFASAGNGCNDIANSTEGCQVGSPGKSHNTLTVGAYNDRTDRIASFSDWINPATGATKPEILAPGDNLTFAGDLGSASGTSFSSPLAAGMAASNISLMPLMKKHPALIKASMLAMATKNNIASNGDSQVNGVRAIQWNPDGWYSWWEHPNSFLNDADGQWKLLGTYNLRSGENVRVALSWLNRQEVCDGRAGGDSYTGPASHLCMELAMKVVNPNGSTVVFQNSKNRNWEAGNFYTSVAGDYEVYVWRNRNSYEWTKKYFWSSKKYYYNDVKLGLRITYIDNQ